MPDSMKFRCALCRKLRNRDYKRLHGGDRGICKGCVARVDKLVLRLEHEESFEGTHVYAGGIACVELSEGPDAG